MKKLFFLILLPLAVLGGCTSMATQQAPRNPISLLLQAPGAIIGANVLDYQCGSASYVLVGPCKRADHSDCAPNYPKIKECVASRNWSCTNQPVRLAVEMDPTLGYCPATGHN